MAQQFICPQGHEWQATPAGGEGANCPVCGEAGEALGDTQAVNSSVRDELPPRPSPLSEIPSLGKQDAKPPAEVPGYDILGELGRGGMGVVYKVRQRSLNRVVALKMLLAGLHAADEELARFRAEAEAIARLKHPNIVHIYDIGEHEGRVYYSLEYVEGGSLAQRLAAGPLPPRQAAELLATLARAVHAAHLQGVIHRDLKPANILLVSGGVVSGEWCQEGTAPPATTHHSPLTTHQPKITDFGLAKQVDSQLRRTQSGTMMGTPNYMAPEQAAGASRDVGPASDVYSLGAILYEMLTGRPPFQGETPVETMIQVLSLEPVPPRRLQPKVAPELETICLKCLEKQSRRRYGSALELADDLRRFLNHEPILARPASPLTRVLKWSRRKPAWAALIALAALAAIVLTVLTIAFTRRLQVERDTAQRERDLAQERLVEMNVANGVRLLDQGDWAGSLLWFGEALRLERDDPARQEPHRVRLGTVLRQTPALLQFSTHDGPVTSVEFGPNRRQVLTASEDRTARLWDLETGKATTLRHRLGVNHAAFSPDGKHVVTASVDQTAQVWNADTGQAASGPLKHSASVLRACFSPDGRRVATAAADGTVSVWETDTGKLLVALPKQPTLPAWVEFSPDGERLATATLVGDGKGGEARIWDARTGQPLLPPLRHSHGVQQASFSPDGKRLATACGDGAARLWSATSGQLLFSPLRHRDKVTRAVFSPDGRRLATASRDGTAQVWDAASGGPLLPPLMHDAGVSSVVFSADGRKLLTAGADQTARVWDIVTGKPALPLLRHGQWVRDAAFSADGLAVATACEDGTLRVWDAANATVAAAARAGDVPWALLSADGRFAVLPAPGKDAAVVKEIPAGKTAIAPLMHTEPVLGAAFSADGERLITRQDSAARVWDARSGRPLTAWLQHVSRSGPSAVHCMAFSPDGRRVATGAADRTVRIWDTDKGTLLYDPLKHASLPDLVVFDQASSRIVVSGSAIDTPPEVWIWDLDQKPPAAVHQLKHSVSVTALAIDPAGNRLATATADGMVRLWDVRTGKEAVGPLVHADLVGHVAFSHDGRRLVTASADSTARVWDVAIGQPLAQLKHELVVVHAAFSPDSEGRHVVTASADGTARVWDSATGRPLSPPLFHGAAVFQAVFNPDGSRAISVGKDGRVRAWDVQPDPRPLDELLQQAQLLAGGRIDASGGLVPLEKSALEAAWKKVRAIERPLPARDVEQLLAWHRQQATESVQARQWFSDLWHLERCLALHPNDAALLARRGIAHAELGQRDQALADYQRAADVGPDNASTWANLGLLRLQRGDAAGFRAACRQLMDRFGTSASPETAAIVAWACTTAPEAVPDLEAVAALIAKASAAQPKSTAYLGLHGAALARAGKSQEGIERLAEAIQLHPSGGESSDWLFLAMAQQQRGEAAKAQLAFSRAAARMSQERPVAWNQVLRAQLLRGEVEKLLK